MAADLPAAGEYRPLLLDESNPRDAARLTALRADSTVEFSDLRDLLRAEFESLVAPPELSEGPEFDRWVYYPWRNIVLGLPGPQLLRIVRLDRNRNNLTYAEQERFGELTVGVVGQSVGHAVAYTLALEGICGRLRLADYDAVELINLNRIPGTLFDIGVNKAVVTARRIAELDPYLPVEVWQDGVTDENLDAFLTDLSIVVDECDSFDIKLALREGARSRGLPLLMQTSDRGLLDVERFDLEPERAPFHGLIGEIGTAELRGLTPREKAPYLIRILDGRNLSSRGAASMVELGESLNSWPQLGSEVMHGGSSVATAVRRLGLGQQLPSGRTRLDLERSLDELAEPDPFDDLRWVEPPPEETTPESGIAAVLFCAQRAPSVGNAQPWTLGVEAGAVTISLAPERSSIVDIAYRGSAMAVGAALYNARAAAAALGILGESEFRVGGPGRLEAILRPGTGTDPVLARDYPDLLARRTNRRFGSGAPMPDSTLDALSAVAADAGAVLHAVTDRAGIEEIGLLLGESDRVRYLTPHMHREMLAELRWPGDDARTGMDLRTLDLAADELAKLEIARRADVMEHVRAWEGGFALGDSTRSRIRTGSAVVAVTFVAPPPGDASELVAYARAGEAVQRVWIEAERHGFAVQPVSPAFLYARRPEEVDGVSPEFADTLTSVQGRFLGLLGVPDDETMAVVLRLSYAMASTVRSRRLPIPGADTRG
ncbi:Rv1355c family protein [Nocardia niigatensis]